jgi:arylsulfatase A-like enzyme
MSTTLQHNLHQAGYHTAIVGKFLNGWNVMRVPPDFDRSVLLAPVNSRFAGGSNAYYDAVFGLNGRRRTVKRYATDFIRSRTNSILRQFNRRDRRPWMMYVNPFAPHAPAVPARRHAGAVGTVHSNPAIRNRNRSEKAPDVRRRRVDQAWVRGFAADQKRTLLAVDQLVAKVFKRLTKLKEARNTLVIFMSDNGMMWGEHGLATKRFPYTHSIKVPMLMRWPGHVRPNSSVGRLVANIDVAPTVYHATGVEPAHIMDGRSLFTGRKRRFVLLENWENTHWRSVRSRRYQYIEYYGEGRRLRFRELYRLKRDPWQLRNLLHQNARRHRAIASRLHRLLVRKAKCKGAECL